MKVKQIGSLAKPSKRKNPNQYRLYDPNGLCPSLTGCGGGRQSAFDNREKTEMKEKVIAELFNAYKGGVVRTIKAQYNNTSYANLVRADSFGATAVMMKKLKIKEATTKGYAEIGVGGVFQMGFPDSKTRRGRVIDEGNTSPTLDTGCDIGVVEDSIVGGGEGNSISLPYP